MKNNNFISFVINILIGILFCFPVFNINNYVYHSADEIDNAAVAANQTSYADITVLLGTSPQFFPGDKFYKVHDNKIYQNDLLSGDVKNSGNITFGNSAKTFNITISTSYIKFRNHPFTDLSYLKELRNTKMLC